MLERFAQRIANELAMEQPVVIQLGPRSRGGAIGRAEVGIVLYGVHRLSDELDQARDAAIQVARECFGMPFSLVVAAADEDRAREILRDGEPIA